VWAEALQWDYSLSKEFYQLIHNSRKEEEEEEEEEEEAAVFSKLNVFN
jgi:hypothetical protein